MDIRKCIANRTKALLVNKKLTQTAFAKEIGTTPQAVCAWCNGRITPSYDWMDILCEYFKVPYEYFYTSDKRAENILNGTPLPEEMESVTEIQNKLKEAIEANKELISERNDLRKQLEKKATFDKIEEDNKIFLLQEELAKKDDYIDELTQQNMRYQETMNVPDEAYSTFQLKCLRDEARGILGSSVGILNAVMDILRTEDEKDESGRC